MHEPQAPERGGAGTTGAVLPAFDGACATANNDAYERVRHSRLPKVSQHQPSAPRDRQAHQCGLHCQHQVAPDTGAVPNAMTGIAGSFVFQSTLQYKVKGGERKPNRSPVPLPVLFLSPFPRPVPVPVPSSVLRSLSCSPVSVRSSTRLGSLSRVLVPALGLVPLPRFSSVRARVCGACSTWNRVGGCGCESRQGFCSYFCDCLQVVDCEVNLFVEIC